MATDDDPGTAETPPLLLNRYRMDGLLGEGGLGTVVKAFDLRLKRTVAIKTLKRTAYTVDPDQFRALEERFAREAEAGARMGLHPNLVAVHDLIVEADRTQYLILEYIPGGTLRDHIGTAALSLTDALHLASDIAQGLHAAHEMGLVHRDIKPANIFLTSTGRAKVGDFGIAQIDDISGRTHSTSGHPGTPLYMSPEQERHSAYLRPASDQYSLGLVLFEMLTGQVYKRVGTRQAAALLAAQPAPVPALVTRMLADEPDDRYPTMEDVARAIQAIERHRATAETQVQTRASVGGRRSPDAEALITTRQETPRIGLQPVPPIALAAPPPAFSTERRYPRRAILIGAGGLVLAVGAVGVATVGLRKTDAVATATIPATVVAAIPTAAPTAIPTMNPTATSAPAATAPPAAPIILTAPPIVITATPMPTPIVITATPSPPTVTPLPPPTAFPTATSPPAARVTTTTWSDPQRRVTLSYPVTWRPVPPPDASEILELDSGDGVHLDLYTSPAQGDAMSGIVGYRDRQNRRTDRSYTFENPRAATVSGLSAVSMSYRSISRSNPSDVHTAEVTYVNSGGMTFAFEYYTEGQSWRHSDDLAAILRSVVLAR